MAIDRSIDQSINQSINQSTDRSINQSIDQCGLGIYSSDHHTLLRHTGTVTRRLVMCFRRWIYLLSLTYTYLLTYLRTYLPAINMLCSTTTTTTAAAIIWGDYEYTVNSFF